MVKKYTVRRYETSDFAIWNNFVSKAKNATFLFQRDFMEYHADRFEDFSLLIFDDKKLVSVFPANCVGDVVYSHQGLTYGGLVFDKVKLAESIEILRNLLVFLETSEIRKLHIKMIPKIYHLASADELQYGLFLAKAERVRADSLSVIDLSKSFKITKTRKESIRRGLANRLTIKEDFNFELFWNEILVPNLSKKHDVKPVHSVQEIELLQNHFPENIRHFNVYDGNKIVAGTTVFISENVAHPQYISGNSDKIVWDRSIICIIIYLLKCFRKSGFLISEYRMRIMVESLTADSCFGRKVLVRKQLFRIFMKL